MSRGRKLIFAQIVISAIALAVVYATLLTPADDNLLFGVEAPNDAIPTNPPQDGKPAADKKAGGQGDAGGSGQGDGAEGGGVGGPTFEPGSSLAPADSPLEIERSGPTVTQYRNTLTEIRQRLEAG